MRIPGVLKTQEWVWEVRTQGRGAQEGCGRDEWEFPRGSGNTALRCDCDTNSHQTHACLLQIISMSFEQTLDQIDRSLESMRQSLARSEELLAGLGDYEPDYEFIANHYLDEISNDHERHVGFSHVGFSQPIESFLDEDFEVGDDPSVNSRRLSFSSDTSSETVVYYTPFDYIRYDYYDYEADSDEETVVGEWEEPWRSPS